MLRHLVNHLIQKRNPRFELHSKVSFGVILLLAINKLYCLVRSFRLLLVFKVPRFMFLGKNVRFHIARNMSFGKWIQIHDYCFLSALGDGKLTIGHNVSIGAFSRLIISTSYNNPGKYIRIGNNVGIGEFAYLGGGGGLEIGDDCIIGQYLSCHPENHIFDDLNVPIRHQGTTRRGIKIGQNCWIGSKVTILDNVSIGSGCIVAAGSVVTKDMPENAVIAGVPAKVINSRVSPNGI